MICELSNEKSQFVDIFLHDRSVETLVLMSRVKD